MLQPDMAEGVGRGGGQRRLLGEEAGGFGQVERRWDRVGSSDPFTWEALSQPQGA